MKRIGLVGCGVVADYGHLPVIKEIADLDLAALYDPDPARLHAAQQKFDVPHAFTEPEPFFDSGLDAVAITSPAPAHHRNVLDAAARGLHVLCEKPLAMTEAEGRDMIDAARRAGVFLFTGFDYRFSPVSQTIRDLIADRAVGETRALRLVYIWNLHGKFAPGPEGKPILNERRVGRMLEGGPMVDCGVHQIDLARFWLQSPIVHTTAAGAWVEDYDAPDHVWLHMDHACGAHTVVEISFSFGQTVAEPANHFTYEIIGTDGLILFDRERRLFELRTPAGTRPLPFAHEKNFRGMYEAFARALHSGDPGDLPTGEDGLAALTLSRVATDQLIAEHRRAAK